MLGQLEKTLESFWDLEEECDDLSLEEIQIVIAYIKKLKESRPKGNNE